MTHTYLGIDISSAIVKYGVVLENGNLLYSNQIETIELESEGFLMGLRAQIELVIRNYPSLHGIGIGMSGYSDEDVRKAITIVGAQCVSIPNLLKQLQLWYPRLQVQIDTDIDIVALGEYRFGEGADSRLLQFPVLSSFQRFLKQSWSNATSLGAKAGLLGAASLIMNRVAITQAMPPVKMPSAQLNFNTASGN